MPWFRERLDELLREWHEARSRHPRIAYAVVCVAIIAAVAPITFGAWYALSLRNGFPDLAALERIGEMDQATSVFDEQDRLTFTIYKEQRIEVPLNQVSDQVVR